MSYPLRSILTKLSFCLFQQKIAMKFLKMFVRILADVVAYVVLKVRPTFWQAKGLDTTMFAVVDQQSKTFMEKSPCNIRELKELVEALRAVLCASAQAKYRVWN